MKKLTAVIFGLILSTQLVFAGFKEHYDAGQTYYSQYQYSSAIEEFKKALRINYMDNSARIGLINSYLARATYSANKEKNYEKAANDFRAALFYLKYYSSPQNIQNSTAQINQTQENLNLCLTVIKFNTSPQVRYNKAIELRSNGLFAEAGYEFLQSVSVNPAKVYEQIGDIMRLLLNDEKTAFYYQKAVSMDMNNPQIRIKYARILDKMGEEDLAVREYNTALAKSSDDKEILYALEKIYTQKIQNKPSDAEAIANLGAIYQKQGRYDEALRQYSKAEAINPTNVNTRLNVGTLFQIKKDYTKALEAYDSILILYPDNVQANTYKAQCLSEMGESAEAEKFYKKVISLDPTNQDAKVQIYQSMKDTKTASELLNTIKKDNLPPQETSDILYSIAVDFHKSQRLDDAISFYTEALNLNKNNPDIYINLALAYKDKNKLTEAKDTLTQAKNLFGNNEQIKKFFDEIAILEGNEKYTEATALYDKKEYDKALEIYLKINPPTMEALTAIAACYQNLGNRDKSIDYYKKALKFEENNSDIMYYIGVLYSEKEDWTNSKFYLRKALNISPNNADIKTIYEYVVQQNHAKILDNAIAFYDKANYTEALKLVNQILTESGKNAYALYYRGMIYDEQKKYQLAINDYIKALESDNSLTLTNYLIAVDYDLLNNKQKALEYFKKFVSLTQENNEFTKYAKERIKQIGGK